MRQLDGPLSRTDGPWIMDQIFNLSSGDNHGYNQVQTWYFIILRSI